MIFNYDDQGKLISSIEYDDENVVINRSEYIYDSNGNKVKQLYFDENGQLWINMKYFYDGDKVTEIWFDQDGEPIFDKYYVKYYNDDKKIREEIYKLSTDELMWYEITEYDKLGVQTTTTEYDETGKIIATTKYTVVE